jgi:hypothetical protein
MAIRVTASVKIAKPFSAAKYASAAHSGIRRAVIATLFAVKARAIPGIPVDTGFAKNSLYIKLPEASEYEQAKAAALASIEASGKEARGFLEETTEPVADTISGYTGLLAGGAEYIYWLHEGARGRAGIPFLSQSAADERAAHKFRLANYISEALKNAG